MFAIYNWVRRSSSVLDIRVSGTATKATGPTSKNWRFFTSLHSIGTRWHRRYRSCSWRDASSIKTRKMVTTISWKRNSSLPKLSRSPIKRGLLRSFTRRKLAQLGPGLWSDWTGRRPLAVWRLTGVVKRAPGRKTFGVRIFRLKFFELFGLFSGFSNFQNSKFSNFSNFRIFRIFKFSNFQIFQIFKFSKFSDFRFFQIFKFSNFSDFRFFQIFSFPNFLVFWFFKFIGSRIFFKISFFRTFPFFHIRHISTTPFTRRSND